MNKEVNKETLAGTQVRYHGVSYRVVDEKQPGACKGCALYDRYDCKKEIASICTKGYILERI